MDHVAVAVCTGQSLWKYAERKVSGSRGQSMYIEVCRGQSMDIEVCRGQSMWAAVPVAVRGKVGQLCNAAAEDEESLDRVGPLQRSSSSHTFTSYILTPRIRDSCCCCCSVTEKTG